MKFARNVRVFRGQLDASPFVGVLFLVVIFLLLHSTLVFTPGVKIELPTSPELPGATNATVTVAVDRAGHLYFGSQLTPETDLKEVLGRRKTEHLTLVVMADKSVPYEILARLWDLAREAGVEQTLMATQPPRRARPVPRAP
jgi:biopolymer transport protein ExbD